MKQLPPIFSRLIPLLFLTMAHAQTAPVAAPQPTDIFLLIGQSNMAGRGPIEPQDKEVLPGIWMQNKELAWVPAVDPVHYDKPDIAAVGLARTFARTLLQLRPTAQIGLVPAAVGGSALSEWEPGQKNYIEAVQRAKAALAKGGQLRGILWHQGESDAGKPELAASYNDRWMKIMTKLREDLNAPAVPIVVGQLGIFVEQRASEASYKYAVDVDKAQAQLPVLFSHVAFVSSQGLADKGDHLHFDAASQRELGRRYAHALLMLDPTWVAKAEKK